MVSTRSSRAGILAAALVSFSGLPVLAQSYNIDFNRTSGIGAGSPANTFAGAASQPGWWNAVAPSSASGGASYSLTGLGGTNNNTVQLWHKSSNAPSAADYGSGDFEKLMGDYAYGFTSGGQVELTISGLAYGFYSVYVYAGLPPSEAYYTDFGQSFPYRINLGARRNNDAGHTAQIGGSTSNGSFVEGTNYARLFVPLATGDTLSVLALGDLSNSSPRLAVNGLQIVKWDQPVIHVRVGGSGDRSGRDWNNAMDNLQTALDLAGKAPSFINPQVWVAQGVYKPTSGLDRSASFRVPAGVRLFGGFAGNETSTDQRSIWANVTQLSGNLGSTSHDDDSYHVIRANGPGATIHIDGFNIAHGNANGIGDDARGGAAFIRGASVVFRNCFIVGNRGAVAGAVYITQSDPDESHWVGFVQTDISQNSCSGSGGGIHLDAVSNSAAIVYMHNCRIDRNSAPVRGGGIYADGGRFDIHNTLFMGNSAMIGGALSMNGGVDVALFRLGTCTIANNSSSTGAAGIDAANATLTLTNSIIWSNTSQSLSGRAAQVRVLNGQTQVSFCNIQGADPNWPTAASHNTGVDPRFADADGANNIAGDMDDDYRLTVFSPCIDAGNNSLLINDMYDLNDDGNQGQYVPVDLALSLRRIDISFIPDTGVGTDALVDLGCYEAIGLTRCPADFNQSGSVTVQDIFDFLAAFFAGDAAADFNASGQVSVQDIFDYLAAYFSACI